MPALIKPYPTRDELTPAFMARFWAKVKIVHDDCWLWQGATDGKGYGVIVFRYRLLLAHRVAHVLRHGSIPQSLVLHSCDVQRCCNPDHLHLGDHDLNMAEAVERKRFPSRRGADNQNSRLTPEQAREMRERYAAGEPIGRIAKSVGLSWPCAKKVVLGLSYANV